MASETALVWVSSVLTDVTGGHLFQRFRARPDGSVTALQPPAAGARRRAPSLFGLGLLERAILAVPSTTTTRVSEPTSRPGRFGWKARYPTLDDVVAGALAGEMGLTSRVFRGNDDVPHATEVSATDLRALVEFVRSLPPPPAPVFDETARVGEAAFARIGCTQCHRAELDLPSMSQSHATVVRPYTDLILHDLGPALADGITEGRASSNHFRTAPLWGLGRLSSGYLHDARARTLDEAIRAHAGEATAVARAYAALNSAERRALLAFLRAL